MNDLTSNKFIMRYKSDWQNFTLNTFFFGEYVAQKTVDRYKMSLMIRHLLLSLGFDIHHGGFDSLAMLVELYLIKSDYDEDEALDYIAECCAVSSERICANISEIITLNHKFLTRAESFFDMPIEVSECTCISDAVEMIGALFKIYYNMAIDSDSEPFDRVINLERFINDGK